MVADDAGDAEVAHQSSSHDGARPSWCGWCGSGLVHPTGAGRPRRFCKQGCRQQAHIARKLETSAGLGDDQLIVGRRDYETLMNNVASLRAAVADLERWKVGDDLANNDIEDLRRSLDWLLSHAKLV